MKKIILIMLVPFFALSSCSIFNTGKGSHSNSNSLASTAMCSNTDWSPSGHAPCFSCVNQANSLHISTPEGTGCSCITNFTWGNGSCNGAPSTVACGDTYWYPGGYVPIGGTCNSCDTATVLHSLGTSNSTHTACNCDTTNSYYWNASTGHCSQCGVPGVACCTGNVCNTSALICQSGTCNACGGSGNPCCAGNTCTGALSCLAGTCSAGAACGAVTQACCAGATPCDNGLICQTGTGTGTCVTTIANGGICTSAANCSIGICEKDYLRDATGTNKYCGVPLGGYCGKANNTAADPSVCSSNVCYPDGYCASNPSYQCMGAKGDPCNTVNVYRPYGQSFCCGVGCSGVNGNSALRTVLDDIPAYVGCLGMDLTGQWVGGGDAPGTGGCASGKYLSCETVSSSPPSGSVTLSGRIEQSACTCISD
jgi:hypothetical protein